MSEIQITRVTNGTLIRAILFIFAAYLLFKLSAILLLVVVSIVIASFVEAGVQSLARYKIRRMLAVPLIFTIAILILFAILYTFVPIVVSELSDMLTLIVKYIPSTSSINSQSIEGATQLFHTITKQSSLADLMVSIRNASSALSQGASTIIGSTFGGVLNVILIIVMSFYLSIQEEGIDAFLRVLTPKKHEKYVIDLWGRTQRKIGLWFKGQLLLGLIVCVVVFAALALLGVKYALILGIVSGIAELVPFGIVFAAVPAILFAAIDGGVVLGVKVMIFYVVMQQIENYVLSPVVARHIVGIPPLVVLLSFLVGITLAGFWGAIIAMPVAMFILEYLSDVEKSKLDPVITNPAM